MKQLIVKSNFFSCNVMMQTNKVEGFLKRLKEAWMQYKEYGKLIYPDYAPDAYMSNWMNENKIPVSAFPNIDRRRDIQDDYLTVKIKSVEC